MGEVKNQLFLEHINKSLEQVRAEFRGKFTPKKDNRFLIKGITYEVSPCDINGNDYAFEISSKIPQDIFPPRANLDASKTKYFNEVIKILNKLPKRPAETKMENIIHGSLDVELKERDYVKLLYKYKDSELYTMDEVAKRLKGYISKGAPIPDVPGVATPVGKMVIHVLEESIKKSARQHVLDLVEANETIKKATLAKTGGKVTPEPKKPAASKPVKAVKPVKKAAKPAAKKAKAKTAPKAKPVAKKAKPAKKTVARKPAAKPAVKKAKSKRK
ncbi:MAG: hypothetical protein HY751_13475 [Nitrospinae bacterium]|nr:hypothetical protein [Nitrospinota bacterium]